MKLGEPPSVRIISLKKSGLVIGLRTAPKHQTDAVLFEQIENDQIFRRTGTPEAALLEA